mgnify:CR=1 FL=1
MDSYIPPLAGLGSLDGLALGSGSKLPLLPLHARHTVPWWGQWCQWCRRRCPHCRRRRRGRSHSAGRGGPRPRTGRGRGCQAPAKPARHAPPRTLPGCGFVCVERREGRRREVCRYQPKPGDSSMNGTACIHYDCCSNQPPPCKRQFNATLFWATTLPLTAFISLSDYHAYGTQACVDPFPLRFPARRGGPDPPATAAPPARSPTCPRPVGCSSCAARRRRGQLGPAAPPPPPLPPVGRTDGGGGRGRGRGRGVGVLHALSLRSEVVGVVGL